MANVSMGFSYINFHPHKGHCCWLCYHRQHSTPGWSICKTQNVVGNFQKCESLSSSNLWV